MNALEGVSGSSEYARRHHGFLPVDCGAQSSDHSSVARVRKARGRGALAVA